MRAWTIAKAPAAGLMHISYPGHAPGPVPRATLGAPMRPVTPPPAGSHIAFRCDGDELIGAGHVARCVPLAAAFAQLGWTASFVGAYEGLAAWLLARAGMDVRPPDPAAPCGILAKQCTAAILDSYLIEPSAICELARTLPVVTLAESNRCPTRGILLDYHLDRTEPPSADLLAGPSFAPLDPALAGAGRAGIEVRSVLVTMGGSLPGRELLARVVPIVSTAFPDAEVLVAGAAPAETPGGSSARVISLRSPSALVDVVADIDLAVTAAGFTAYEMACAGIPQVAIAIVANQRRVVRGLQRSGLAACLDLTGGDSLADLPRVLEELGDDRLRRRLARRGRSAFDGNGARRAAAALTQLFGAEAAASEAPPRTGS
jgi:UDP-2,4-diacetamido-2,4,6-trideoxy-beta-L-altropyranose hydrolase